MIVFKYRYYFPLMLVLAAGCRNQPSPLFETLNSTQTGIRFKNIPASGDSLNILDYLYYYNGGGVSVGDINNDGLPDIFFTANCRGNNKLYLNKGHFKFEDITDRAGVAGIADWCSGTTMADVNGDGWLDIYVCSINKKLGLHGHNQLLINNHNGTFTDSAAAYGLDFEGYSTQAVFFDFDHDGDLDCFLLNQSSHSTESFGDTSLRRHPNALAGSRLFRNDIGQGKKKFTDVTAESGIYSSALGYGLGVGVADLNNDGWEDIYVSNDFHENDYYYVNNRNGTFTESGAAHFNHYSRFSMGNDIADYNNDAQPDIITLDMLPGEEKTLKTYSGGDRLDIYNINIVGNGFQQQFSKNCLQVNLGHGAGFSERALQAGIAATDWSWSPLLADYDNDGMKDLFISNGIVKRPVDLDYMQFINHTAVTRTLNTTHRLDQAALENMPGGEGNNLVFQGRPDGRFTDRSAEWGMTVPGSSTGAAYADLDNDGNLDLVVNRVHQEAGIFRNTQGDKKKYLNILFAGSDRNTSGIGCKTYLIQQGHVQYQQLMLTRGFQSSSDTRLHFGTDTLSVVDSLLIIWPDQHYQLIRNVQTGQQLVVRQRDAKDSFDYNRFFPPVIPLVRSQNVLFSPPWKHRENAFLDFQQQRLIPHELSTMGPKIAVADLNGDGLDDLYACGAAGQSGAVYLQNAQGHFVQTSDTVFLADAGQEDTDAIFFDADNDGDADLYVTSGGNQWYGKSGLLLDRLYLNDGKGHFSRAEDALPLIYANKSVVCAADIDHDGDLDLFVGGSADAQAYGIPQDSYLLINNGKGKFSLADPPLAALKQLGMVTAAAFADLNQDGQPDLVIAGEWMPVQIFINRNGILGKGKAISSSGLWQSLLISDADGDGKPDILAGNYGLNSKLHATKTAPLHLFVKDFDNNGITEQLLTYRVNGKEYPFLGKEELEKQLPSLKKQFLHYKSFAGKTSTEIFGDQLRNAISLHAETLETGLLHNEGGGNFLFQPFPADVQESPAMAFLNEDLNQDGLKDIFIGGNLFGVIPFEGRYDANWGDVLLQKRTGGYDWISPVESGFMLRGEVRDIKKIKTAGRTLFGVSRNNDSLLFFQLTH